MLSGQDLDRALFIAVQQKQYKTIELCLKNNAKLSYKDGLNQDAFHIAAKQNDLKAIKLLLDANLEPDGIATDKTSHTPIYSAARAKFWDCVRLFAQRRKEDSSHRYQFGKALLCVVKENRLEEAELLLKAGAATSWYWDDNHDTLLHQAVRNRNAAMIRLLLNYKAGFNEKNKTGFTAFTLAVTLGAQECIDCFASNKDDYLTNVERFLNDYNPWSITNFNFITTFPSKESNQFYYSIKNIWESSLDPQERKDKIAEQIRTHVVLKADKQVSRSVRLLKKYNLLESQPTENKASEKQEKEVIVSSNWTIIKT